MSDLSSRLGLPTDGHLRVLAIGAHPDDIEIGAGGTILRLLDERPDAVVTFAVLSGTAARAEEARASAAALAAATGGSIACHLLEGMDGYLPYTAPAETKGALATLATPAPNLVLVHRRDDAHQDHRFAAELAWQVCRWSIILEYEVPKWDGDLGSVDLYVTLPPSIVDAKVRHLATAFPSQADKHWYGGDTFRAILRLRGMESRAPSGHAEGFVARKLVI